MTKKLMIALVSCFAIAGLAAGCESPAERRIDQSYEQREKGLEQEHHQREQALEHEKESMKHEAEQGRQHTMPPGE